MADQLDPTRYRDGAPIDAKRASQLIMQEEDNNFVLPVTTMIPPGIDQSVQWIESYLPERWVGTTSLSPVAKWRA